MGPLPSELLPDSISLRVLICSPKTRKWSVVKRLRGSSARTYKGHIARKFFDPKNPDCTDLEIMVKEEETIAEAAGARSYMDMLGLGEEADYLMCLSPSSYLSSPAASATTAAASPTCASYLAPSPYHHLLSFSGQDQCHGYDVFGFQYYGGDHAIPVVVPQKSSPTT
ncbi:hypothetical protein GUJ93_ZPchr0013g35588 [Zizania palustris]|uniref:Uncharacterized protein n=1 Tax=Zizania palustris TaxID=103762 RepID=A0A8J6BZL7_ZIZPA|nr:hypothetical protein GUJ93_ZPchr0013g35588 [Zizania palustris]